MTTVVEAFAAVMGDVLAVRKTGHNQAQNFNFRGVDAVMNAVGPALRTHGVVISPRLLASNYRDIEVGQKRTLMREVTVEVEYTVRGPEGDCFVGSAPGEAMDSGDKGTAKAMSVAYRTFLLQALTIPTDEPDPDEQSVQRAAKASTVAPLLGWASIEEQTACHEDLKAAISASAPEVQENMREYRKQQGYGWPVPFNEYGDLRDQLEIERKYVADKSAAEDGTVVALPKEEDPPASKAEEIARRQHDRARQVLAESDVKAKAANDA